MSRKLIIPLGGFLLASLCVVCVLTHSRSIEQDLRTRAASALSAAGVQGVNPAFSGRDATLDGTVASQGLVILAEQTVNEQHGVRIVDNRLQVASGADDSGVPRERETFQRSLDERLAGKTIGFRSGSAVISLGGRLVLDGLLPLFEAHPGAGVEIGGHTDARGTAESNLDLSRRRAAAVKQYLVEHGVEQRKLFAVGYGETAPVADNETAAGRRENRRITFEVLEGS